MKKTVLILALFLVACTAPQAIVESPGEVTPPATTPAPTTPVTTPATTETTPPVATGDCQADCESTCYPKAAKVCGQGLSYNDCVTNCGDLMSSNSCKASCATESDRECQLVLESRCRKDCRESCPATA